MEIKWIINIILIVLLHIGLFGIFKKAGRKGWEALIPLYNFWIWLKLVEKPWWWFILLLIPGVNVIVFLVMVFLIIRNFEVENTLELIFGVIFSFIYLPYIGFNEKYRFMGTDYWKKYPRTTVTEWMEAIVFAVIAATIIRTFFLEAFTIPTSSMEKTLLVGDFLFVSKMSYGSKTPNTPLTVPFTHHTLPFTESTPSYTDWVQLPYFRFPALQKVKNNDIVVFNYPDGDTVALNAQNISYYRMVRTFGWSMVNTPGAINPFNGRPFGKVVWRPVDKRDNYVKRCVGIPGDKFEIRNKQIYVNDEAAKNPDMMQFSYTAMFNTLTPSKKLMDKLDITDIDPERAEGLYRLQLNKHNLEKLKTNTSVVQIQENLDGPGLYDPDIFPFTPSMPWNKDNYGPVIIPKAGVTVSLDTANLPLYERIIRIYEENDLKVDGDRIVINGTPADSYTFKQDYYFMMGDNRHYSADSRYWGFVPHDHIVGKAVFIWLSRSQNREFPNIRFERVFSFIKSDGISKSYFFQIMIPLLLGIWLWNNRHRFKTRR